MHVGFACMLCVYVARVSYLCMYVRMYVLLRYVCMICYVCVVYVGYICYVFCLRAMRLFLYVCYAY